MKYGKYIRSACGHFKTISEHRAEVCRICFQLGLYWQGLTHDLSKYAPEEFRTGVLHYQGDRSPNAAEREERGFSPAWLHHKGHNKHHYEYWTDVSPRHGWKIEGVKMPVRYVGEMFADRIAACKTYQKEKYTDRSPWEYYHRMSRFITIHPQTRALLERLLKMLAVYGEDKTFAYVRHLLRKGSYPADIERNIKA